MGKHRTRITTELIQREVAEAAKLSIAPIFGKLFDDRKMFDSAKRFRDAGFKIIDHSPTKIMSGSHKLAPGYLFKKYNNDRDTEKQLENYMRRIEGARLLATFIEEHGYDRVVVPRKWLHELPLNFPERYILIVEMLNLASDDKTKSKYGRIDKEQTRELATILFYFRGLNSTTSNLPFTEDGRIAFIDTERWHHDKDYLRKIGDYLPGDRRDLAMDIYKELSKQRERPFCTQFK